jgi:hypothetical protein
MQVSPTRRWAQQRLSTRTQRGWLRNGAASLEYVLVLGASLPMLTVSYYYAVKIIRSVYEMTCSLICWPFM